MRNLCFFFFFVLLTFFLDIIERENSIQPGNTHIVGILRKSTIAQQKPQSGSFPTIILITIKVLSIIIIRCSRFLFYFFLYTHGRGSCAC